MGSVSSTEATNIPRRGGRCRQQSPYGACDVRTDVETLWLTKYHPVGWHVNSEIFGNFSCLFGERSGLRASFTLLAFNSNRRRNDKFEKMGYGTWTLPNPSLLRSTRKQMGYRIWRAKFEIPGFPRDQRLGCCYQFLFFGHTQFRTNLRTPVGSKAKQKRFGCTKHSPEISQLLLWSAQ